VPPEPTVPPEPIVEGGGVDVPGVTWMWEARAAPGRGDQLLAWALEAVRARTAGGAAASAAGDGPGGAQVYRSRGRGGERVVVILHRPPEAGDGSPGAVAPSDAVLPAPPAALLARPPQAWDFVRVETGS
jgi:hypothetical protein